MILLVDTSVLIDALLPRRNRSALLAELARNRDELATSVMNIAEVYAGLRPGEEDKTEVLLSSLTVLPLSAAIAQRAGELVSEYARQGITFALADMIVAATALEHGCIVMTDNRKDFAIAGLDLYLLP